ncbi:hypothetical protein WH47_01173, partial [Habropoda laboriosa]
RDRCHEEQAPRPFSGKEARRRLGVSARVRAARRTSDAYEQPRAKGTSIFIVPWAGRPAKTAGDSQS